MSVVNIDNITYDINDLSRVSVRDGTSQSVSSGLERSVPDVFSQFLQQAGVDPETIQATVEGKEVLVRGAGAFSLPVAWAFREMGATVTVVSDFGTPPAMEGALGIIEHQGTSSESFYFDTVKILPLLKEVGAPISTSPMTYYSDDPQKGSGEFFKAMQRVPGADPVFERVDKGEGMTFALTFNAEMFNGVQLRAYLIDTLAASGVIFKDERVNSLEPDDHYDMTFTALGMGHREYDQSISATLGQILAVRDPENCITKSEGVPRDTGSVNLVKIYLDPDDPTSGIVLIGATKEVDQNVLRPTEEAYNWLVTEAVKVNPAIAPLLADDGLLQRFRACPRPINTRTGLTVALRTFERLDPENLLGSTVTGLDARVTGGGGAGNSINWGIAATLLQQAAAEFKKAA